MIPVCQPLLSGKEKDYVDECIDTNWISSKGRFVDEFEKRFSDYCSCSYGISTTNGTTALHLALSAADIGPGDEVIMPAFTIISTALAAVYCGAKPVLVDCDPETWNIRTDLIEEKITKKTKAILPVHIYGHPCDMDPVMKIADENNLLVVEDAAEVHGAEYKGRKAGGIGDVGCFSFYANKIITCGEGGMVVTNSDEIAGKAKSLKDLSFMEGGRNYTHDSVGFNYRMTNIQAAIGLAQFENIDNFVEMRRNNATEYSKRLKSIPGIRLPVEKDWAKNVYWMYSIVLNNEFGIDRDQFMQKLLERGIDSRKFFVPMHRQPLFTKKGMYTKECYPISEYISENGLYLPSGSNLQKEEIQFICDSVSEIYEENN